MNGQVVSIPFALDASRDSVLAVGASLRPYPVLIYEDQTLIAKCHGHHHSVRAVASFPATFSETPCIVSGDLGGGAVLVFDPIEGTLRHTLSQMSITWRILTVSEWKNEVFVGGSLGGLQRFDLVKCDGKTSFSGIAIEEGHGYEIVGIEASIQHDLLFTVNRDGTSIMMHDHKTQLPAGRINLTTIHRGSIKIGCCSYDESSNLLILGTMDSGFEFWDVRTRQRVCQASIGGRVSPIWAIEKVEEGTYVSGDRRLALWSLSPFTVIKRTRKLPGGVVGLCVLGRKTKTLEGQRIEFVQQQFGLEEFDRMGILVRVGGVSVRLWKWVLS